jgi:formate dehydrogenase subunit gamma
MSAYSAWDEAHAAEIIKRLAVLDGPSLPILQALQHSFGFISERAVEMVADALNLSRAEVHGVVSFYPDFRREPPGRHVVRLCRAEACQALGADALAEVVKSRLGVEWHGRPPTVASPLSLSSASACAPAARRR